MRTPWAKQFNNSTILMSAVETSLSHFAITVRVVCPLFICHASEFRYFKEILNDFLTFNYFILFMDVKFLKECILFSHDFMHNQIEQLDLLTSVVYS